MVSQSASNSALHRGAGLRRRKRTFKRIGREQKRQRSRVQSGKMRRRSTVKMVCGTPLFAIQSVVQILFALRLIAAQARAAHGGTAEIDDGVDNEKS